MTQQNWIEFALSVGAIGAFLWLGALVRFLLSRSDFASVRGRLDAMLRSVRALGVLLSFCRSSKNRDECAARASALEHALDEALRKQARGSWLFWLRPSHAWHLCTDAAGVALRGEPQVIALLARVESQVFRRVPLARVPLPANEDDPLLRWLASVEALLEGGAPLWSAAEEILRTRPSLPIGPSPAELVERARAALARPETRSEARAALADAAWMCAAAASLQRLHGFKPNGPQRPHARKLNDLLDRVASASKQASQRRSEAHQSVRYAVSSWRASSDAADRLFAEAETLLRRLAYLRGLGALQRAIQLYEGALGRASISASWSSTEPSPLAGMLGPLRPGADDEAGDVELPDLDLPDWPSSPDSDSPLDSLAASAGLDLGGDFSAGAALDALGGDFSIESAYDALGSDTVSSTLDSVDWKGWGD